MRDSDGAEPDRPSENNLSTGDHVPQESDEPDFLEQRSSIYRGLVVTERIAACALLCTTLGLVVLQVVTRYVFDFPLTWTEELARFALVWLTFVAAGFVMARRIHISVDLVASKLGRRGQVILDTLALIIVILASGAMTWFGFGFVADSAGRAAPASGLPLSVLYGSAVVGFGLICGHSIIHTVLNITHPELVPDAMENIERESA